MNTPKPLGVFVGVARPALSRVEHRGQVASGWAVTVERDGAVTRHKVALSIAQAHLSPSSKLIG